MARLRFIRLSPQRLLYLETRYCDGKVRAKGVYSQLGWMPRAQLKARVQLIESLAARPAAQKEQPPLGPGPYRL